MRGAALLSRLTTDAPLFLRMPGLARDPRGRVRSELFVPVLYNFIRSKRKGSGQSVSQSVISRSHPALTPPPAPIFVREWTEATSVVVLVFVPLRGGLGGGASARLSGY